MPKLLLTHREPASIVHQSNLLYLIIGTPNTILPFRLYVILSAEKAKQNKSSSVESLFPILQKFSFTTK
jgi:hypothetical protein